MSIERTMKNMNDKISDLKNEIETFRKRNKLLEEQALDLFKKVAIFELENMELRLKLNAYELDL
jgi:predicted  nucleic acid-binding Zn-ribbon protein